MEQVTIYNQRIKKSLIIILLVFNFGLSAQTNRDSIYTVWQDEAQTDSIRVAAFKQYIWDGYMFSKPDSAFILAEVLYGFASFLNATGLIYLYKNNYNEALGYFVRSVKIFEEIDDQEGVASALNNIGYIYHNQDDYANALDYYSRSLKIREEIEDQQGIATSLVNIGEIYSVRP